MGAAQSAPWVEEPTHDRRGDRVRRVGHDVERPSWQPEVGSIGTDDPDRFAEPRLELARPTVVQLDGDDAGARVDQRLGDRSPAGADVEDEGALGEPGVTDEPAGSCWMELVPSPPWRPGHGDAPS